MYFYVLDHDHVDLDEDVHDHDHDLYVQNFEFKVYGTI
jgi:hypothetical protein